MYRTKPVVKEALQLRWDNWNEMCEFAGVGKLSQGKPEGFMPNGDPNIIGLNIPTLEGVMQAVQGDWIIRGLRGELYSCKPDIFERTYEPVEPTTPAPRDGV